MGIHALLTTIAPICETVTVWRRCKGANVGVDAFGWLHQLAMNHYEELATRSVTGLSDDNWEQLAQKAQHQLCTEAVAAQLARFQAFFRNVRADLSLTADSFFSKNGCAVSVTMWGDHLAQLMQKIFRAGCLEAGLAG